MDKKSFLVDFINEVYRACDALDLPVPDGIDDAASIDDLLDIAESLSCRLVPALVSSDVQVLNVRLPEEGMKRLAKFFEGLPSFRLKVLPNPGYPVFKYRADDDSVFFEALYFPGSDVCLIARFSYRDLQMFRTIGDHDTDTRIALGRQARECADLFRS